jgi:outer membrane protein assembly factor BamB
METPSVSRPRVRWWPALVLVALSAAAIAAIQSQEDMAVGFRFMFTALAVIVTVLLLLLWVLFFSRLRWRTRLTVLGVTVAIPVTFILLLRYEILIRYDGSEDGTGRPRFVWAWVPRALKDKTLSAPKGKETGIDLKTTTKDDYPRFLGAEGQPAVRGVFLAPDWSAQPPKQLWRERIGVGWSSFAVVGRYAVTQEQIGDEELVVCYQVQPYKVCWSHANKVRFNDKQGGDGPRATPTIHGGLVYAMGATGILDCLDGATGKRKWWHDVLKENNLPNIIWGKSCSPLIVKDLVVVTGGAAPGPSLIAYHKDTGKEVWRAGDEKSSYSSPTLVNLAGRPQILTIGEKKLTAHDPDDGHVLWEHPSPGGMAICAQPIALPGDRVLMPGGMGGGCALLQLSKTSDGSISVHEVWKTAHMKPGFATMAVRDGYLYGLDDGWLACVDLRTGRRTWKGARFGSGQLLLAGDKLIVQAEKSGEVALVEATPEEYRELGRCPVLEVREDTKIWNNPVLSGKRLLVRSDEWAACYELPVRLSE